MMRRLSDFGTGRAQLANALKYISNSTARVSL